MVGKNRTAPEARMTNSSTHINQNGDIPARSSGSLCKREVQRAVNALADNRIELFFQPIVRADSSRFVAFYEGLVRIRMPEGTLVSAGQFMPFIDNTPLGVTLDCYVLKIALHRLAKHSDIRLSINLSVLSMASPEWLAVLEKASTELCSRLIIEVTEGTAMSDISLTTAFMNRARKKGCGFALDDFGTGATSFRYFKDFLFDFVKIDGMFIQDLAFNKDNQVLVKALIDISKHFDMVTVAEFIETSGEAEIASELGIDCLQGHLIGKPTTNPLPVFNKNIEQKMVG